MLKDKLLKRCIDQGVMFGSCAVDGVDHEKGGSVITLKGGEDGVYDGQKVYSKMVLDATGHARKLVDFERDFTPGYQAAFGIMCETEAGRRFDVHSHQPTGYRGRRCRRRRLNSTLTTSRHCFKRFSTTDS